MPKNNYYKKDKRSKVIRTSRFTFKIESGKVNRCNSMTNAGSKCKMPTVMNGRCIYHQRQAYRRTNKQTTLRRWYQ